jgi:hypothetical protein
MQHFVSILYASETCLLDQDEKHQLFTFAKKENRRQIVKENVDRI